jgi:hypothetical protein
MPLLRLVRGSRLPLLLLSSFFFPTCGLLASYAALNLGAVSVTSSSTGTISIPLASAPPNVTVSLHFGTDFSIGSCVASGSSCSVAVTFSPTHAGLRQDAVIVKDSGGNVLAEGFVYGTGKAPQVTFNPGVLQILYTGENQNQPEDTFTSLASDQAGNLYLAKGNFNIIVKFAAGSSTPVTIAGQRLVSGTSGDGGPATAALLTYPTSLAVDAAGNVYFVDGISVYRNQFIRRIDGATGIISQVSGSFYGISALAVSPHGDLYIGTQALYGQAEIQKIDGATYAATLIAGGSSYNSTGDGGPAASANFASINGLAVDSAGNLFVADYRYIRRIDATTQIITSIAGNGTFGTIISGTPALTAPVSTSMLTIDPLNNLYFAVNGYGNEIYKIDPLTSIVTYFAGGQETNYLGIANGDLSNVADFFWPSYGNSIAFDASGNYYVATAPIGQLSELVKVNTTSPSYSFLTLGTYPGNPSPLPVTVNNIGNQSLSISSQSLTGSFSEAPSGSPACSFPGTIAADSGCSFTLSGISGSDYANGLFTLTDNSLNQASASQQATISFVYPVVTASPSPAVFSLGQVGTPASLNLSITNTSRVPYTFDHAVIQGPNASDFSAATTCLGVQNPILQGGDCYLTVSFTPSSTGTRTATLLVYGNTQNPVSIPLSGTAAVPSLSLSPTSLTLVQTQWQTSSSQVVTVTNTGVLPVTFNGEYYSALVNGAFSIYNGCSISNRPSQYPLLPGQICRIVVYFNAQGQTGQFSGTYLLSTSLPGAQPSISLHGMAGVTGPALTFGQTTLYFTAIAGEVSSSVPLEIKNSGTAAASITSISLTGAQASDFRQFNNCPASLPAGQGCVVWVGYAPTASSPANSAAAVTVASNGSFPQLEPLSGSIVDNAVARVTIDSPTAGAAPVSGTINVLGWGGQDGYILNSVTLSVDHIIVGNAYLTLARPDVCQAYPEMGGCPNLGWSYQLDTTAIADGVHTLTVAAGSNVNSDNSTNLQFTVANGSKSLVPNLFIDSPTSGQNLAGTVSVSGWALSKQGSFTAVSASVDGISLNVNTNARPDVCTAYNFPSSQCGFVGWYASINAGSLPAGNHTLTVTSTANSNIYNQAPPTAVKTVNFSTQTSSNPIQIFIDQPSANQTVSHSFTASGWAVTSGTAPVVSVTSTIDGSQALQTSFYYGLSRPDVCTAYPGSLSCPNVGWTGIVNLNQVSNGPHTITITARASDGSFSTITRQITVDNILSAASDQFLLYLDSPLSNSTVSGVVPISGWVVDGLTTYPEVDLYVDGIPVAGTSPQVARPDVCNVYPWAQGCTSNSTVGWMSHIDTTLLVDGAHTLSATSTSSLGKRATTSIQFLANNSSGRQTNGQSLYIDSPAAGATSSGALSISGWAVSKASPVTAVDILIDGVPMGAAAYGLARQDVCTAYPNSAGCPNVGWYYVLDTRTLADGPHTVEAVEETAGGSAVGTQKFNVSNAGLSSAVSMVIDAPAPNSKLSGTYPVSGWAIDNNDSIASVAITVDDLPQGFASYGGQRTDVCNVFPGRAGCPNVGWSSTLDTTQFENGSHTLTVTVKSTHGDVLTLSRVVQTAN